MEIGERIAIIGGGISGLCIGYWLKKKGIDFTLFEQNNYTGGTIITERSNGFLIDYGPNSALETSEVLKNLVTELSLDGQKIYGNEASNKRYIVKNKKLHQVPMSAGSFLTTGLFSLSAKLKLLKEPFTKPTEGEDVSLADFVRHRLGQEFLDYAINPFVAGVYAGDPENLSTAAAFPKLYALEKNYGSLIKGAVKGARERKKRKETGKDRARLFSFIDGMDVLPNTLYSQIKSQVHLNTSVKRISTAEDGFLVDYEKNGENHQSSFKNVITAVPASALAFLINDISSDLPAILDNIYYPPVAVVYTGFKAEDIERPLDGFGFLVPEVENRQILGTIWSSTIFPNRVPDGHVAFTTFIGGTRQPENAHENDPALEKMVFDELNDLIGLRNKPAFVRIKRWPKAIPQYNVGYKKIQEMFDELETTYPGLFIAGNIRKGISVGDSVLCAHEVTEKLINFNE